MVVLSWVRLALWLRNLKQCQQGSFDTVTTPCHVAVRLDWLINQAWWYWSGEGPFWYQYNYHNWKWSKWIYQFYLWHVWQVFRLDNSYTHCPPVAWNHFACAVVLPHRWWKHYNGVIMTTVASQITSLTVVCSIVYSGVDQRKHQSSASLAFVRGIHRDRWISRTKGQ